jgi:hypothetical protein
MRAAAYTDVATLLNNVVNVPPKLVKIPTRTRPKMLAMMPYSKAVTALSSLLRARNTNACLNKIAPYSKNVTP